MAAPAPTPAETTVQLPPEPTEGASAGLTDEADDTNLPSPKVDVHAVFGLPRPKRSSERSDEVQSDEESGSDCFTDSDDDTEEWQEGEYLVIEDDDELQEVQMQMLSQNASLSREMLVPVFKACAESYNTWLEANQDSLPEEELAKRRRQLELYQKVLELYGSDEEWESFTYVQHVERNTEAHEVSLQAKELGLPPDEVTKTSISTFTTVQEETFSEENFQKRVEQTLEKLNICEQQAVSQDRET